ncbi:hypothetical protein GIB67_026425 [Kingdonia uniflora]|uniref:40S ribosomal protein S15a n=1 Tax=Kingdonia uniflora TaxID=39325 RepID=A0A7J7P668_9MAGN|nr:hypothetical protein GIB67_026425 [Kingdonia uniflora]
MVRVGVLNDGLKSMSNAKKQGKRQVMITPSSQVITKFLLVMQAHGYISYFDEVDDHRSGKIVLELNAKLNECGVISHHFDVAVKDIEAWTGFYTWKPFDWLCSFHDSIVDIVYEGNQSRLTRSCDYNEDIDINMTSLNSNFEAPS